jgi:ABC-type amino acid transport substrate-binding protein
VNVEIVVTGPASPALGSVDELSGKTVHVRKASSYYESLSALNVRLSQAGKPEAKLVFVPDALEDEDMLEMVNAGLLEVIVVDDWKAKMWAQVLPKIKVHDEIVVRPGTRRKAGRSARTAPSLPRRSTTSTRAGRRSRESSPTGRCNT